MGLTNFREKPVGLPANRNINHQRVRDGGPTLVAQPETEESADGRIRQPSWGRLGLEIVTDLVGWLVVFAVLQAIGTAAIQKVFGTSLFTELVLVLILFFAVTLVVRVVFTVIARRAVR